MSRGLLVVLLGVTCAAAWDSKNCAIILSSAGAVVTGRDLCIRYSDVDEAFGLASSKVGLLHPARVLADRDIAQLGTALQETTRILAKRFWLSRWEVENVLPRLDTRKTAIGRFCGQHLARPPAPCPPGGERYRRHDGTCNNLLDPVRGSAMLPFKRLLPPLYADRISEPRVGRDGSPLPAARLVSTRVHGDVPKRHDLRLSFMFPAWGQLIDHDLTLTAETKEAESRKEFDCCAARGRHPNCLPLEVPPEDPFFKERRQSCINMARSLAGVRPGCTLDEPPGSSAAAISVSSQLLDSGPGLSSSPHLLFQSSSPLETISSTPTLAANQNMSKGSRVQMNLLTSYIDANFIYGSSVKLSQALRSFEKGHLKTSDAFPELGLKHLLPPKTRQPDDGCIRPHPDIYCFLAGDNRVNEQLALGVLHTLAVREHNRIASELAQINPHWTDEKLYQETRHIMAALVQHITYNEFLPVLLGEEYLKRYELKLNPQGYIYSYDPEVDATIPASFGTAAFRFGHSLLPNAMQRRSPTHKLTGERRLSEMLQQPFDLHKPGWVDAYTLGMVNQLSQPMDQSITAEVTNHLFQEPARDFGRDLAAINLGRAREHGVPGYMAYRRHCGLEEISSWQDMWSSLPNATVAEYLKIYDHPDDVDLWSGGVSELAREGSVVGPVFSCLIATTFRDLRKGDRFWYENRGFPSSFTLDQLREIKKYSLSRFLCNSGDNIATIQLKAMLLPDYDENPRVSCKSGEIPDLNLEHWRESPPSYPVYENGYSTNHSSLPGVTEDSSWTLEGPSSLYRPPPANSPDIPDIYGPPPASRPDNPDIYKPPPASRPDISDIYGPPPASRPDISDIYGPPSVSRPDISPDTIPYPAPPPIYETDIRLQENYPPSEGQHQSLAFLSFSESDKYAIREDFKYNRTFLTETYPTYDDYTNKDKGDSQQNYDNTNYQTSPSYSDKIVTEHYVVDVSKDDTNKKYGSNSYSNKPVQSGYNEKPLTSEYEGYPSFVSKPLTENHEKENYPEKEKFDFSNIDNVYQSKPSYSTQIPAYSHPTITNELLPPIYEPGTDLNSHNKGRYPVRGGTSTEAISGSKGYFITTPSYAEKNSGGIQVSSEPKPAPPKPDGFDQIVTDLFHDVNNNKSELVLELKDTYNLNSNTIIGKTAPKET